MMIFNRNGTHGISPSAIRRLKKAARINRFHFVDGLSACPRCKRPIILADSNRVLIENGRVTENTTGVDVGMAAGAL